MSAHTPGPWHRNIPPASKYVTVWSGRNKHVAYVTTQGLTEAEIEANINLVAAAPELLEALVALVKVYDDEFGMVAPEMDAALAAISKATGLEVPRPSRNAA